MGSSAQNSSGVHWCRRRVRFNEVLEKVPKVPEKMWEALVQSQVRFNRVPEKVPEKVWEALVQSQVKFNRVPEKVPEKIPGGFGAEPGQVQQGSGEGSGEGLGGFGAAGQVQQGSGEGSRRRSEAWVQSQVKVPGSVGAKPSQVRFRRRPGNLWCRARSGSTEVWEALVQSQVRFNRVPEKVPEKVWEALVQSQVRFNRVPEKVAEQVRRRFWESLVQGQVRTGFPALGLAARFRKISKNKTLRLLGIPPKLILFWHCPHDNLHSRRPGLL